MGIDRKRIKDIEGVKLLRLDVYSDRLDEEISAYFIKGIDLVLSDLAPNTTGNKTLDGNRSVDLVERAFEVAKPYLRKNGKLVAKVFHSSEIGQLKKKFEKFFNQVHYFKPKATRQHSREIFLVATGYIRK